MSDTPARFSLTVEFKAGDISLHEDGSSTFHFRGMDYVYLEGTDSSPDGWRITLNKVTTDAIKRLFRGEATDYS